MNTFVNAAELSPLPESFFRTNTVDAARALLGAFLVDTRGPAPAAYRIVETEAYTRDDPACHAFRGKTVANAAMFGPPGTAYVHINYGLHHCLNAVFQDDGIPEAVLIRAIEPVPLPEFQNRDQRETLRRKWAGPGRLTKTLGISKPTHNAMTLADSGGAFFLAAGESIPADDITTATRIGITKGADFLWRFYVKSSPFISRRAPGDPSPRRGRRDA